MYLQQRESSAIERCACIPLAEAGWREKNASNAAERDGHHELTWTPMLGAFKTFFAERESVLC